jgi:phosphoglycerol transferase MdoB-like AlkP superfamily enzyme
LFSLFRSLSYIFILLSFFSRAVLSTYAYFEGQFDLSFFNLVACFGLGLLNDIVTLIIIAFPLMSLIYVFSHIKRISKFTFLINYIFHFLFICGLVFNIFAEYLFWEEFGTRFNFIAVDYLVYTSEVIGNLKESYPINKIFSIIFLISIVIFGAFIKIIKNINVMNIDNKKNNTKFIICLGIIFLPTLYFFENQITDLKDNRYISELDKNGIYNLFSAFKNNVLDYNSFYKNIPNEKAFEILKSKILQENQSFLDNNKFWDISRKVNYEGKPNKHNVVLIVVESLSSEFIGKEFNGSDITPNLSKLKNQSIYFSNLYATGTRTVRGLESLTLSVPPTPGSSIVRRPNNENLFNISTVLSDNNYESTFLYGGYGYFDNMNYFFANNGFKVVDRGNLSDKEISFANIWGVADENILTRALKEADDTVKQSKKPFFQFIMTTSNHRPYTFPENSIDLPSGQGREAAVKYTDYAIGKFLEEAKQKEWFDNTIFIITADHCHSSAGKTQIPIKKYHIPMFVYAPKIIKPSENNNLMSQMDIPPTILGLLNISYTSKFFGNDIYHNNNNIIVLGTYQLLGYYNSGYFSILAPKEISYIYNVNKDMSYDKLVDNQAILEQSISYYQTASYLYKNQLMKNKSE